MSVPIGPWLLALDTLLLARLWAFKHDTSTPRWRLVLAGVGQLPVLLAWPEATGVAVTLLSVAAMLLLVGTERGRHNLQWRLGVIALWAASSLILISAGASTHRSITGSRDQVIDWSIAAPRGLAMLAGFLLCAREAGMVLRLLMRWLDIRPPTPIDEPPQDPATYRHGAVIGGLERILITVFVLHNAYNAIAFILTAKGLVRLHEFTKSREFAEYVLIGTLISTLLGIAAALAATVFLDWTQQFPGW